MDAIQKELVKAGRKDLAIKYYKKVAVATQSFSKNELDRVISKLMSMKPNDLTLAFKKSGMSDMFFDEAQFKSFYFSTQGLGLTAVYFVISKDDGSFSSDSDRKAHVYISWNGQDYSADI